MDSKMVVQLEKAANETLAEWFQGYLNIDAPEETTTGTREVKICMHTDGRWKVSDPQGYFDYGFVSIEVKVTDATEQQPSRD